MHDGISALIKEVPDVDALSKFEMQLMELNERKRMALEKSNSSEPSKFTVPLSTMPDTYKMNTVETPKQTETGFSENASLNELPMSDSDSVFHCGNSFI